MKSLLLLALISGTAQAATWTATCKVDMSQSTEDRMINGKKTPIVRTITNTLTANIPDQFGYDEKGESKFGYKSPIYEDMHYKLTLDGVATNPYISFSKKDPKTGKLTRLNSPKRAGFEMSDTGMPTSAGRNVPVTYKDADVSVDGKCSVALTALSSVSDNVAKPATGGDTTASPAKADSVRTK